MAIVGHRDQLTVDGVTPRPVVWLRDDGGAPAGTIGSKAAVLARVRRNQVAEVLDGFVVTVADVQRHPTEPSPEAGSAWRELTDEGRWALVVRSSSPVEDLADASMAGVFDSVVDVRGWQPFVAAYRRVVESSSGQPMAVLVQRLLVPTLGGVLFGVDPVNGDPDRLVVAAVCGGPHELVSGAVRGRRTVIRRSGRVVEADGDAHPELSRRQRRGLARLASDLERHFGTPQDIEWAIDGDDLVLLQSRPITTTVARAEGPLLGPGPVAETFPTPLTTIEQELWVPPLRTATAGTLAATGSASRRRIARSPVVTVVDGQVVADLELTGFATTGNRVVRAVDPRPALRRLVAAWRVGRLRGAFPDLCRHVLGDVDRQLALVPATGALDDRQLLDLLENSVAYLRALHAHEMLAGALVPGDGSTGAAIALRDIALGRARGWSDEDIVARRPTVLAVVPPSTGPRPPLPAVPGPAEDPGPLATREELRLRIRWLHELTRQAVRELGDRLVVRGLLADEEQVRHLGLVELTTALDGVAVAATIATDPPPPPVPARFRLTANGAVVADAPARAGGGTGASPGRVSGPVVDGDPSRGDVLVVRTLAPSLAPVLATVVGIVAETGSPLSHLAILAREQGVPVVVGFDGALDRFPPGTVVVVDGSTGEVDEVEPREVGS